MNRLFILFLIFGTSLALAAKELPIPRFVSIKFNEVNARTGPAVDCPIEWVFITKGEPVEVIAEYDQWRKIRDIKGEGGWVHSSALSGNRSVAVIGNNVMPLLGSPENYDKIVVKVSPSLRCSLLKCKNEWCQLKCNNYKGWIARKFLWGVYPDE
jgi:SH3-like domain-containing protein